MNRVSVMFLAIAVLITMVPTVQAGSIQFQYKLAPDQVWIGTMSSQSETTFMGKKDINRTRSIIEYRISKGPKRGWVSLTAKIKSQKSHSGQTGRQMDLSKITFFADMHPSGDIRNIRHEGNPMPPPDPGMPPEMKAMYAQSSNMVADTKTAGKGETVFDMESGMWTDLMVKSRSKVNMSNVPGMANMSKEVLSINKYEMEQK